MRPIIVTCLFMLGICISLAAPKTEKVPKKEPPSGSATPAEQLMVTSGFSVSLLRSANTNEGSWISMAVDNKGRLYISPQQDERPLLRITLTRKGEVANEVPPKEWTGGEDVCCG